MSRNELVEAYLDRRISRRTLVRRLVAGGVSTGAAISYAQLLDPERAPAQTLAVVNDHYPLVDLTIASTTFAQVRGNAVLQVLVVASEEIRTAFFRVFLKTPQGGVVIGAKDFGAFPGSSPLLKAAGSKTIKITVNTTLLTGLTTGVFYVQAQSFDAERYPSFASASKTLS
jgi:hypothetical protein